MAAFPCSGRQWARYSIAHHEIGHALFFDGSHPRFAEAKLKDQIDDPAVVEYYGGPVVMDRVNHFPSHIDPASGLGAFGNEYNTLMPPRRWLITKLDLLCAQAGGYKLRPTTAFETLKIAGGPDLHAEANQPFKTSIEATGGIPFYQWDVLSGSLPPGLTLDSFTGDIAGVPLEPGVFEFEIRVRDYDLRSTPMSRGFTMIVAEPALRLGVGREASGAIGVLSLSGPPGRSARIEVSDDLMNWVSFRAEQPIPSDVVIAAGNRLFFRAVLLEN